MDKGGWEFATLSFPRYWHLALSSTRRVSHGCQFPDATPICTDHAGRSGSVAKPATAVVTPRCGLPGEASGPGQTARLQARGPPDRVASRLRNRFPRRDRRPQGRHSASAESLALRHGSCLLPLEVAFGSCKRATAFLGSARVRILLPLWILAARQAGDSLPGRSLREKLPPLRVPSCEAGTFRRR
jgi:hypothetical protein